MSYSNDPDHFFQTDASESTRARKAAKAANKYGDPIILQSKILAVVQDPFSPQCIYVAESAGCVRRINLETKESNLTFRGPVAPVTTVAIGGPSGDVVFAGCWDKTIWSWERSSTKQIRQYKGHSDFVKTVICARLTGKDVLISGGADAKIIVWDTDTGERLHTIRDKRDTMMALQSLVVDPEESTETELVIVSASSDPHIRRWRVTLTEGFQIIDASNASTKPDNAGLNTILQHETSVYNLIFIGEEEDCDLWTASADGTAKCLSRSKGWTMEEYYKHGDYVRAVAVTSDLVVTAGRDEDVKVWDKATGKLWHIYEGHYEEITGLLATSNEQKVVSVSIDGTVRVWPMDKAALAKARKERTERPSEVIKEVDTNKKLMTAEEEAELAELMDSDDA